MPSLAYQPTREDLLDAARLQHLSQLTRLFNVVACVADAVLVFGLVKINDGPTSVAILFAALAGGVIVALLAIAQLVRPRFLVGRLLREQRSLQHAYTLSWSPATYGVHGPTISSELPWQDFLKWRENARVFLLYHSRYVYQFVPKRLLSPEDVEFIRTQLRTAGVRQARIFLS